MTHNQRERPLQKKLCVTSKTKKKSEESDTNEEACSFIDNVLIGKVGGGGIKGAVRVVIREGFGIVWHSRILDACSLAANVNDFDGIIVDFALVEGAYPDSDFLNGHFINSYHSLNVSKLRNNPSFYRTHIIYLKKSSLFLSCQKSNKRNGRNDASRQKRESEWVKAEGVSGDALPNTHTHAQCLSTFSGL